MLVVAQVAVHLRDGHNSNAVAAGRDVHQQDAVVVRPLLYHVGSNIRIRHVVVLAHPVVKHFLGVGHMVDVEHEQTVQAGGALLAPAAGVALLRGGLVEGGLPDDLGQTALLHGGFLLGQVTLLVQLHVHGAVHGVGIDVCLRFVRAAFQVPDPLDDVDHLGAHDELAETFSRQFFGGLKKA